MTQENLKQILRDKLKECDKDTLVDIVADVCALYVAARTVADMSGVNCIQQPINNIQTDIQRIDSITSQRINANCFNKQDVIK